jgi:PAS domain S-box-containing protein
VNAYAIPVAVTFLAIVFLGLYVLVREKHSSVKTAFFLMTLPVAIWLLAFAFMYSSVSYDVARFWSKAAYFGVPFIPTAIYYFTVKVLRTYDRKRPRVLAAAAVSVVVSAVMIGTDFMMDGLYQYEWGYYAKYTPYSAVYLVFFFGFMIMTLRSFVNEYKKPQTETHRQRIKWLLVALSVAYLAGVDYLGKFGVACYPFGYAAILVFIAIAARVVTKYRLLDITSSFAADKILCAMGDALLVLDAEDIVRVANNEAARLFEKSKNELLGSHLSEVGTSFPARDTVDSLNRFSADHVYEIDHEKADGELRVLQISEAHMKDGLGCVIATVLVVRDLTEVRKIQTTLAESLRRYDDLYKGVSEAIVILDEFGRFSSLNPAAEKLLGADAASLAGRIFVMSDYLPSSAMGAVMKAIRSVMQGNPEAPFKLDIVGENKKVISVEATAISALGRVEAVQIIFHRSRGGESA